METIRKTIKNRMQILGVKNKPLCMDLGFKEPNFCAYLKGRKNIPLRSLEKVCMYLGLTLERKEPIQETEE